MQLMLKIGTRALIPLRFVWGSLLGTSPRGDVVSKRD